jgi:hypothetical protein
MKPRILKLSKAIQIAFCVVLVACISNPVAARAADGVTAFVHGGGFGLSCFGGPNSTNSVASASTSCSNPFSAGGATAFGSLATGTMRESAFGAGAPFTFGGSGSAEVDFLYQFTITGAPIGGGTVVFSGSIDGTASDTCDGASTCSNGALLESYEPYGGYSFPETIVGSPYGNQLPLYPPTNYSFRISEVLSPGSSTFLFGMGLITSASCNNNSLSWCTADTDFSHTLQITGAQVYDSNGNLVPDASLISESGFNPNAVPEPSSFLLLGSGLLGIATISRRGSTSFSRRQS